jgi:3-hydroxybutyryl-CoA dehydrogenase
VEALVNRGESMPSAIQAPDLCVGIVGTGAMGRGIAQIAAQAGIRVLMFDALHGAAANARETVIGTLAKLAEKGKISAEALAAAGAKLEVVTRLEDLASAKVIVEAIVENIEVKKALFQQLEDIIGADCILATNTSSLSVTSIAATCKRPERVGGFHFFNPVPLMKIVEVIDGLLTAPWVSEALLELGRRMGHTAVAPKTPPASSSTTPDAALSPKPCACWAKAWRISAKWTASCARSPVSAWGHSSCSTSPGSTSRTR